MGYGLLPSLAGIPAFVLYAITGAALLTMFCVVYVRLTAHDEIGLIRAGNAAAAVAFGGSLIGFSIPLSRAVSQASSIPDLLIWAALALAVQFFAYLGARRLMPDLSERISKADLAAGILVAALSIASGMLNAASMTL